jgi:hypothetical protein
VNAPRAGAPGAGGTKPNRVCSAGLFRLRPPASITATSPPRTRSCELNRYQIYREVKLHSSLQHENIIMLYAAFQQGEQVVLVQEYADAGDLFLLLHRCAVRCTAWDPTHGMPPVLRTGWANVAGWEP